MVSRKGWQMIGPARMERVEEDLPALPPDSVCIRVAGCGVCHTDLGFFYEGTRTRHPLPLTLGHEISGFVIEGTGLGVRYVGDAVLVPAVMPCGECALCREGLGGSCPTQIFPGNDMDGGFASYVVLPARGLCRVPDCRSETQPLGLSGVTLPELSVIADAVSTPYQAVLHSGLRPGDTAIVIGTGGVGGYAVQIGLAMGANVIAIDVRDSRLAAAAGLGATALDAREPDLKKRVRALVKGRGWRESCWKIFECSGTTAGQATAWELLGPAATLMVVGFTRDTLPLRLSNLMAFDATARGTWGCLPQHYPAILEMVLDGRIDIRSQTELRSLSELPEVFSTMHNGGLQRRVVLVPDHSHE